MSTGAAPAGAAAFALALALAACAALGGGDPLVESGAALYARRCAPCHGREGRGSGPVAPALRLAPPDLTRIAERSGGAFPAERVAETIDGRFQAPSHGLRTMPVWGRELAEPLAAEAPGDAVARGRLEALVAYLRSIQSG